MSSGVEIAFFEGNRMGEINKSEHSLSFGSLREEEKYILKNNKHSENVPTTTNRTATKQPSILDPFLSEISLS
jgi:hypothetical protein